MADESRVSQAGALEGQQEGATAATQAGALAGQAEGTTRVGQVGALEGQQEGTVRVTQVGAYIAFGPFVPPDESSGASGSEEGCPVSTQIQITNQALLKIGVSQAIEDVDEQSREAVTAKEFFPQCLRAVLRTHPWAFATKYAAAADEEVGYMDLIEGSEDDPTNGDWTYMYRYPIDCLMARRMVVEGTGRRWAPNPEMWRKGRKWTGSEQLLVIFSDIPEADAILEYTALVECSEDFEDPLFEDALSWHLAAKLAPSLARNGLTAIDCTKLYLVALDLAGARDAGEQQQDPEQGDASWVTGR